MLLGVDGVCVISHGSSSSVAIVNAITVAHDLAVAAWSRRWPHRSMTAGAAAVEAGRRGIGAGHGPDPRSRSVQKADSRPSVGRGLPGPHGQGPGNRGRAPSAFEQVHLVRASATPPRCPDAFRSSSSWRRLVGVDGHHPFGRRRCRRSGPGPAPAGPARQIEVGAGPAHPSVHAAAVPDGLGREHSGNGPAGRRRPGHGDTPSRG